MECQVNFAAEQATVRYNPKKTQLETIQEAVADSGYGASPLQEIGTNEDDTEQATRIGEQQVLIRKLIVGGVISVVLFMGALPMITGFTIPLIPQTMNKSESFKFRASRVGKDTVLAQIVQLVQQAQGSKAPIQRLGDRVTGWFVPVVIAIAILIKAA